VDIQAGFQNCFLEVVNPRPLPLDFSNYMFVYGGLAVLLRQLHNILRLQAMIGETGTTNISRDINGRIVSVGVLIRPG